MPKKLPAASCSVSAHDGYHFMGRVCVYITLPLHTQLRVMKMHSSQQNKTHCLCKKLVDSTGFHLLGIGMLFVVAHAQCHVLVLAIVVEGGHDVPGFNAALLLQKLACLLADMPCMTSRDYQFGRIFPPLSVLVVASTNTSILLSAHSSSRRQSIRHLCENGHAILLFRFFQQPQNQ